MIVFEPYSSELVWILIVGFLVAFVLAFGIGANDVANSFGTSVGSRVLTLRQACVLATIFEILGSILIGAKVSDTIRKGIIDPTLFENPKELMLGQISSLIGCCIWLLVATFFNLPVSGTHSIVGATVGFALVAHGARGIQWVEFGKIGASWFASPALAGIISIAVFLVIRKFILQNEDQLTVGLRWLPVFYGITIMINVFSIILSAPPLLYFDRIPLWGNFITTIGVGILVGIFVMIVVKPRLRRSIEETIAKKLDREEKSKDSRPAKTDGRFQMFNVNGAENANVSEKQIQTDYIAMIKEFELIDHQEKHPELFRPYVELSRTRRESEGPQSVFSVPITRTRRESERTRSDITSNEINQPTSSRPNVVRERPKVYRLHSFSSPSQVPGSMPAENKSLLLGADDDTVSNNSTTIAASEGTSDIDDFVPEKKKKQKADDPNSDSTEIASIFKYLQILTAIFGAFAHGGNDVSNAIGPLIGIWLIFNDGTVTTRSSTPLWVLFYGGLGISVGLWVWGRRVIRTIGEDLTKITPSSGFVIEISTAFTVLVASNLSIPVSTTHCKVGSVVAIGRVRSKQSVDWSLFRNIFVAWIVTVPVTGGISAGVMALLRQLFL